MDNICSRCFNVVDVPTSVVEGVLCENCKTIVAAAKSEPQRTCLKDGKTMEKEMVLNIIIDKCPSCGGVWLDGGEIDVIKAQLQRFDTVKDVSKKVADFLASGIAGIGI